MDAAVYAPVFLEGKLFAWVYNVVHQRELGGVEPGGFIQQAHDVYAEPTFMPPMKLVDAGKVREDVVDAWVRRSRLAELMTSSCSRRSPGSSSPAPRLASWSSATAPRVKGAMRKMIPTPRGWSARVCAPCPTANGATSVMSPAPCPATAARTGSS